MDPYVKRTKADFVDDVLAADHNRQEDRLELLTNTANTQATQIASINSSISRYETTADITLYIDPISGSDSNDGLSPSRPIRTNAFLRTLIPFRVKHNIVVNCAAGEYDPLTLIGTLIDPTPSSIDPRVLFSGTTGLKTLTTGVNTGNPGTAAQDYIDKPVGAPNWTVNEMVGELLFVVAGPNAGKSYLIRSNTASRMYLAKPTTGPLNVLDTFEVRERKTKINCSVLGPMGYGGLEFFGVDGYDGGLNNAVLRMDDFDFYNPGVYGGSGIAVYGSRAHIELRRCKSRDGAGLDAINNKIVELRDMAFIEDPSSFVMPLLVSDDAITFLQCLMKGGYYFYASRLESLNAVTAWFDTISNGGAIERTNCYFNGCDFNDSDFMISDALSFGTYQNKFHNNSLGNGLSLRDIAYASLYGDNFSSNASSGIKADRSRINASSLVGSLNAQYGVNLVEGSFLKVGAGNTLTGTLGDIKPGALVARAWGAGAVTDPTQLVRVHS